MSSYDTSEQHTPTLEESYEQSSPDQAEPSELSYGERETHVCLGCGGDIPADVGRVVGDNDANVYGCRRCFHRSDGKKFDTHARAATQAQLEVRR